MLYHLIIIISCFSLTALGNSTNASIDARIFLKDRLYNKQDEQGNTFLHQLALNCSRFSEWKHISQEMQQFANENNGNMPNPLIENNNHATARKLAKDQFNELGNPICGTLILFLREAEYMYLDRCSSEGGRKDLAERLEKSDKNIKNKYVIS